VEFIFNLSNCVTKFSANDKFRRCEVIFNARPNEFTISTTSGELIVEKTKSDKEGTQIEVAFVAENFDGNVHGYMDEIEGWGLNIALSCTELQMSQLLNFYVNGRIPTQLKIQISGVKLIQRNFKLDKTEYKIDKWQFEI
jgi:hypothetical protein